MTYRAIWIVVCIIFIAIYPPEHARNEARSLKCYGTFDLFEIIKEDNVLIQFVVNPAPVEQFFSVSKVVPKNQKEKISYAIGQHESANFKACPKGCENSHNYWGRKAKSGGYMQFSSEKEAWEDQMDYLERRFFSRGVYSLQEINRTYAEDPNWYVGVQKHLDALKKGV